MSKSKQKSAKARASEGKRTAPVSAAAPVAASPATAAPTQTVAPATSPAAPTAQAAEPRPQVPTYKPGTATNEPSSRAPAASAPGPSSASAGTATSGAEAAASGFNAYTVNDPEAFARNMLTLLEDGGKVMVELAERQDSKSGPYSAANEMVEAVKSISELSQSWMSAPTALAEAQMELMRDYGELWERTVRRMVAGEPVEPVAKPEPGDNRFKDPEWSDNPYFDYWKQAYLISTNWAERLLARTDGLDDRQRQKLAYRLRLLSSSISPSNFPATNPQVIRETMSSNAANLVRGMENLIRDLEQSKDLLRISQTDIDAFEVGRNLAVTPGKVVFQNDIFQLIQYTPATETVHRTPLLIVPPWINKFYILDLTPQKSFIRHIVAQGFTVFVVSWVNPDERLAGKTFEDYMKEGVLTAAAKVREETLERDINVLGYCVGGTLLASTLAYLAATDGQEGIRSATFLTTQVDFSKAGDLLNFIDEEQLEQLDKLMTERGYLDGSRMASAFNMMRPRDLIWPYIVNNYLLGKKPMPFDLLFWNQDSTRMPAANHAFYLRKFYHENRLARGELAIAGVPLDLGRVTVPVYDLATREDHIAPAASVLIGSRLFGGPVTYVLAGSGHIAGVVNPPNPDKPKYQHWAGGSPDATTVEEFVASATQAPGSWWPHWIGWLSSHSGDQVGARTPGAGLGVIEDAPGSYVRLKT